MPGSAGWSVKAWASRFIHEDEAVEEPLLADAADAPDVVVAVLDAEAMAEDAVEEPEAVDECEVIVELEEP